MSDAFECITVIFYDFFIAFRQGLSFGEHSASFFCLKILAWYERMASWLQIETFEVYCLDVVSY